MEALSDWLETIRFDYPILYKTCVTALVLIVLLVGFMSLPNSPMLKAMGINGAQARVSATANGVYWSSRAALNQTGEPEEHTQAFGNIEGIDPAGKLVVSVPENDKWIKKTLVLANAEVTDLYGAAQLLGSLRLENARFDIYGPDRVVVWVRSTPVNVKLIEAGVARPERNPLTNIFDLAFATYYWGIAKGSKF